MKLQAENRFTVTRELFLEGMLRVSRDSYGKYAAKCMLVFVAIWAALLIFTLSTGGSMYPIDELKIAGVDLTEKSFWEAGLKSLADRIEEFCALMEA